MDTLSGQDVLHIWETGQRQHPIDRALTILTVAFPAISRNEFPTLSIGQRDRLLLAVREATFGTELAAFARCPLCQEQLEFTFTTADMRAPVDEEHSHQEYQLSNAGYELTFRLPNSLDLAETCHNPALARQLLIERCVLRVSHNGIERASPDLSEEVITVLAAQMAEHDPQAERQIDLKCPGCEHCWSVFFDIGSFIWIELYAYARRLLREVHTLAQAYGWREADILTLSAARRALYLEMVI